MLALKGAPGFVLLHAELRSFGQMTSLTQQQPVEQRVTINGATVIVPPLVGRSVGEPSWLLCGPQNIGVS